ncbi:uncharacterized protein LOC106088922 [Stomoxys calcitrans]|uniref:uncharacterized protein LOC106088922 n=1 Tax=Stomoxys calcitrans TaxID=35570 RepID=UPI0027E21A1A|nr:uncharacterized protein LOC106088922 [Stomoxys calcitrans]
MMMMSVLFVALTLMGSPQLTVALEAPAASALASNDTLQLTFREGRRSNPTESCTTTDDETGTCMSRFRCMNSGGAAKGYCDSYNVCCETNLQCGGISKLKRIIIRNPSTITSDRCEYRIKPYSPNVCQLLIEFQLCELQPPNYDPGSNAQECEDHLQIGDFTLCGDNTGQHLYIPFHVSSGIDEISLIFNLPNRWPRSRWRIVITQLECPVLRKRAQSFMPFVSGKNLPNLRTMFSSHQGDDRDLIAPPGCHQYFTKMADTIRSFNFNEDGTAYYLPNLNYVICIRPSPGATMIEYQATHFSLSNGIENSPGYDGDCHSTIFTDGRRQDYLMIPQSYVSNSMNILPTYYCGTSLQTRPSLLASPPFIMYFSSDGFTDEKETGFSINYRIRTAF